MHGLPQYSIFHVSSKAPVVFLALGYYFFFSSLALLVTDFLCLAGIFSLLLTKIRIRRSSNLFILTHGIAIEGKKRNFVGARLFLF